MFDLTRENTEGKRKFLTVKYFVQVESQPWLNPSLLTELYI